jgi:hypothetical protein
MSARVSLVFVAVLATAGCVETIRQTLDPSAACAKPDAPRVASHSSVAPGGTFHLATPKAKGECVHFHLQFWEQPDPNGKFSSINDTGTELGSLDAAFSVLIGGYQNGVYPGHTPTLQHDEFRSWVVDFDEHSGNATAPAVYGIDTKVIDSLPAGAASVFESASIGYHTWEESS